MSLPVYCEELGISGKIDVYKQDKHLMGMEGTVSKSFFAAYFQQHNWKGRHPRIKSDILNVTLDIGYTILFNYMECFLRMFGFDLYVGVYHRLWFKRKSLVCDLMEPFRPIIDTQIRKSINLKQFNESDFSLRNGAYVLNWDFNKKYVSIFLDAILKYKTEIFTFIQSYYRNFMKGKSAEEFTCFSWRVAT